jgi:hypothetical protein
MKTFACLVVIGLLGSFSGASAAQGVAAGGDRFEVTSLTAVRGALARTVAALEKGDVKAARAAFDEYDAGWNGVEVYINTRDKAMYSELETNYQAKIAAGLKDAAPDTAAVLSNARAMLAKYDEALSAVKKGAALSPLYDEVARLRIVRAYLRAVTPAVKGGDFARASASFGEFNERWDSIEDLIKARSPEAYEAIERGMIQIERALMAANPDASQVTTLTAAVMDKYNAVVADITKDARAAK